MKPCEYKKKDEFWHKFNADYLVELKGKLLFCLEYVYFLVVMKFILFKLPFFIYRKRRTKSFRRRGEC